MNSAIAAEVTDVQNADNGIIDFRLPNQCSLLTDAQTELSQVEELNTRSAMFRLYNKYTGEHFYTSNSTEKKELVNIGWTDEGVGWYAPKTSKTPVYRLYNPYVSGGDHHYTISQDEYNQLKLLGWKQEGVGWYSTDEGEVDRVSLLRQYNPYAQTGTHNYTQDKNENDELVKLGWRAEGVGWYGYSEATPSIQALDFSKISVTTTAKTYNAKAQTQTVNSSAYRLNTDFSVAYSNNKNAGTATIVVKGKGNYTGTRSYTFKINKATSVCKAPTGLTGYVGDKLSSVDIASETVPGNTPGKFEWTDGEVDFTEAGDKEFAATFIPTDTKNYETVEGIGVTVKVTEKPYLGYWLGTKNAGAEYVDEAYFANSDSNYVSGTDISADMKVLHDKTYANYATIKDKWDKYYSDDNVRLYATYDGGENEGSYDSESPSGDQGKSSELNKYVEFRILEVSGADGHKNHDGTSDGSAVTFMATHVLPTAYQMNSIHTNVGGWGACALKSEMNSGAIFKKFSHYFISKVKTVTKEYNTGNMAAQSAAPSKVGCKFWVPSYTELVSATASDYASWLPKLEGSQYAWCATNVTSAAVANSCLAHATRGGAVPGSSTYTDCIWRERSPSVNYTGSFGSVGDIVLPISSTSNADAYLGVVPCFAF